VEQPPKTPKPLDTTALLLALVGLVKEIGAVVALAMMEWARIKQHQAEDKAAFSKTDLEVLKAQVAVEKANAQKDPRDIINDFLGR